MLRRTAMQPRLSPQPPMRMPTSLPHAFFLGALAAGRWSGTAATAGLRTAACSTRASASCLRSAAWGWPTAPPPTAGSPRVSDRGSLLLGRLLQGCCIGVQPSCSLFALPACQSPSPPAPLPRAGPPGIAPVRLLLDDGVNVGLGTDRSAPAPVQGAWQSCRMLAWRRMIPL